jgi:hypothetical protein|tara:strand:- start:340 stop:522 length:183 start_codon:yes stop_codon:yes gene_type:complete
MNWPRKRSYDPELVYDLVAPGVFAMIASDHLQAAFEARQRRIDSYLLFEEVMQNSQNDDH